MEKTVMPRLECENFDPGPPDNFTDEQKILVRKELKREVVFRDYGLCIFRYVEE